MKQINSELQELAQVVIVKGVCQITIPDPDEDQRYAELIIEWDDPGFIVQLTLNWPGPKFGHELTWHAECIPPVRIAASIREVAIYLEHYGYDLSRWEVVA